jgi:transposase
MGRRIRHSREFKLEAVRVLGLGQKPASQLALELGVRRNQLYKWKDQLGSKGEKAFCGPGRRAAGEESEVVRLKRALEKVTEERDILKKAAAYFARELP